jgi:hypothetical protein
MDALKLGCLEQPMRRPGNENEKKTSKKLLRIARLKIHPGKREELNPALSPAPLPEQAPAKQSRLFAR